MTLRLKQNMHEYNMPTILLAALPMEVHQMHKFIILALFLVIFANNALAQTVREPAVLRDACTAPDFLDTVIAVFARPCGSPWSAIVAPRPTGCVVF